MRLPPFQYKHELFCQTDSNNHPLLQSEKQKIQLLKNNMLEYQSINTIGEGDAHILEKYSLNAFFSFHHSEI